MARGDLHTHSTKSDGVLTPTELVRSAAANGVDVLALTDHDTTDGVAEATEAGAQLGLRVIAGVELSADLSDGDAHILAYFRSADQPRLQRQLAVYREGRVQRGRTLLEKLAALAMPLDWQRVRAIAGEAAVGRPHVAQAMVEAGYVSSVREAFDRFLHTGGPADAPRQKLNPEEALDLIRECGGVAVLAHPSFLPDVNAALDRLVPAGLQGLEVYYKNETPQDMATFHRLAEERGLIPTGGSDYHGIHDDECEPGRIPLPGEALTAFLDRLEREWAARQTGA